MQETTTYAQFAPVYLLTDMAYSAIFLGPWPVVLVRAEVPIPCKNTVCPICDMECPSPQVLKTHIRLFHLQSVKCESGEIDLESSDAEQV